MTQEINLLGSRLRRTRLSLNSAAVLGPVLLIASVAGLAAGLFFKYELRELRGLNARNEASIKEAQDQQRKLAHEVGQVKKNEKLEAELVQIEKRRLAVQLDLRALDNGSIGSTRGFSDFMRALAHQSVDGVWLTGFNVGAAGQDISISGRALRAELVPAYLKRLGQDPYFAGRNFALLDVAQPPANAGVASESAALTFNLMSRRELAAGGAARAGAAGGAR